MPQRNVATNFTFEQQRLEINLLASDFWTQKGTVDTASSTYLKHDGSNAFTGQTLAVPNAFTINPNSGGGTVTIAGNLDVTGTTTTVSSANLEVTDKNILIAKGSTSDSQADGAGITIDSATDITWNFVDAKDAWVSSIGVEATTTLKVGGVASLHTAQFTGTTAPTAGSGVEIGAPDANTGQIIVYDRDNSAYKQLNLKGSSVQLHAGTSNALVGTFNSTGLSMESGKTITGNVTGNLTGNVTGSVLTAAQTNITSVGILTSLTVSGGGATIEGTTNHDGNNANTGDFQGYDALRIHNNNGSTLGISADMYFTVGTGTTNRGAAIGAEYSNPGPGNALYFATNPNAITSNDTLVERMRISPDGKVLIGTSTSNTSDAFTIVDPGNAFMSLRSDAQADNTSQVFDFAVGTDNRSSSNLVSTITATIPTGATAGGTLKGYLGFSTNSGDSLSERMIISEDGKVGIGHHSYAQVTQELTIRPANDGGIRLVRPGDTTSPGNTHLTLTTTASGSAFPTGEAYTVKYKTNNSDQIFETYTGGGTGGNISFRTSTTDDSSESLRITPDGDIKIPGGGYLDFYGSRTTYRHTGSYGEFKNTVGDLYAMTQNDWKFGNGDFSIEYLTIKKDDGHVLPGADNTQDLGSSTLRWANVYTGDLNLCNEGSYNEVDGTSGSWTMQEGDSDLFLINRKSGKKYKFNLTEVS